MLRSRVDGGSQFMNQYSINRGGGGNYPETRLGNPSTYELHLFLGATGFLVKIGTFGTIESWLTKFILPLSINQVE